MTTKNYAELGELCKTLIGEPFELLAFPCNQFLAQEAGSPERIRDFVTAALAPYGATYTLCERVEVNGKRAHPVWQYLRYNAGETRRGAKIMPIPWNFGKFLVDKEGRVLKFFGPGAGKAELEPSARGLLDGSLQGAPPQRPTVAVGQAPSGFAPYNSPAVVDPASRYL